MATGRLQHVVNSYRSQLAHHESKAEQALNYAHAHTLKMIQPQLDKLYKEIEQKLQEAEDVPLSFLYEARRLQTIKDQITKQVDQFSALARMQTANLQHTGIQLGMQAAQAMLKAVTPSGIRYAWGIPDPGAISSMVGATQAGSPLADLFNGFGAEAADGAGKALITGVSLGWNPRRIAPQVEQALDVPRWRALVLSRNEMLRAYKTASLATYRENSDVIRQWRWTCDKSPRSCALCLAMDGSLHDLSEDLASHVQCRCASVPVTASWEDILGDTGIDTSTIPDMSASQDDYESGQEWFDNQSAETQKQILGNATYAAYSDGAIPSLRSLVGTSFDKDWGHSRYVKSLKQVLGKKQAQQYYAS